MSRVLVVGSYPPVPRPAATATVAAVRRAWADGDEVVVVSPRPSAAHRSARIEGFRAPWELARLGRRSHADALVLCVEVGMPLDPAVGPRRRRYQVALLARAFKGFPRVSLVVADDLAEDTAALAALWPHAHDVVVATEEERQAIIDRTGVPRHVIRVDARGWEPRRTPPASYDGLPEDLPAQVAIRERAALLRGAFEQPPSVTPFGPPDWAWYEHPRRLVSFAARRLLGSRTDAVRAGLVRLRRRVQPARR